MPKKDFTQVAFSVVQQATGEAPKPAPEPKKKAAPTVKKVTQSFGFKSYEIKTLNFTQQVSRGIMQSAPSAMASSATERATVPIPAEGGRSSVSISVTGSVELLR